VVSTVRILFLLGFLLVLSSTLVAAHPSCNPPASGDWTISDTTVMCDNGTNFVVSGNVTLDNATFNLTNGTILNVTGNFSLGENSSIWINGSTLNLTGAFSVAENGSVEINGSTLAVGDDFNINDTATVLFNQSTVVISDEINFKNGTLTLIGGSLTFAMLDHVGPNIFFHMREQGVVSGSIDLNEFALFNASNATLNISLAADGNSSTTILIDESTYTGTMALGGGSGTPLQARFTNSHINGTFLNFSAGLSLNITDSTLNISENMTIKETALVVINETNITVASGNYLLINDTADVRLTTVLVDGDISILNGTLLWQDSVKINDSTTVYSYNNATVTLDNNSDLGGSGYYYLNMYNASSVEINNSNIYHYEGYDTSTANFVTAYLGRLRTDTSASEVQINLTNSEVSETLLLYGNFSINFFESNNVSANIVSFVGTTSKTDGLLAGNVTFTQTSPSLSGEIDLTRVFPLSLFNESFSAVANANVTIVSNPSTPSSFLWTGTTDSNGYIEPNLTFTSSNYDDTFYLYLPDHGGQYREITLLEDTPINWSGVQTQAPYYSVLESTGGDITTSTFGFNLTVSNDTVWVNYTIHNGSHTWTNGTYNTTDLSTVSYALTPSFDGLYLPVGNWTVDINVSNGTTTRAIQRNYTSAQSIVNTVVSGGTSGSTSISGSNLTFTFNVSVKGAGTIVAAYLNLTTGSASYNANNARLSNGTHLVPVGQGSGYTGAGNVTLPGTNSTPGYVEMDVSGDIFDDQLSLIIVPYAGLIPGTYTGSYGFGVFG
jgi:hypothetical protein